jgi:hypothetical protein
MIAIKNLSPYTFPSYRFFIVTIVEWKNIILEEIFNEHIIIQMPIDIYQNPVY